ncbi:adhesion G protein-coupled receptor F5-like isoform X2 [Erpetoichthys calabaricus]|nr:adhesion G protein-coupled receptor F5-like isoform X2 [Erpetoichthys calabaricus]
MAIKRMLLCSWILLCLSITVRAEIEHLSTDQSYSLQRSILLSESNLSKSRAKRAAPATSYILDLELNISDISVLSKIEMLLQSLMFPVNVSNTTQITNVSLTTICTPVGQSMWCNCTGGLVWTSANCSTYGDCYGLYTDNTCGCIKGMPMSGSYCQPKPPPTTPITSTMTASTTTITSTTTGLHNPKINVSVQFKINADFTTDLTNKSSVAYQNLKGKIEKAVTASYSKTPGFQSVEVIGFGPGSIAINMSVTFDNSSLATVNNVTAQNNIITNALQSQNITVVDGSFQVVLYVPVNFNASPSPPQDGNNLTLTCPVQPNGVFSYWVLPNNQRINAVNYSVILNTTLVVNNIVSTNDSGVYTCVYALNGTTYNAQQTITIIPLMICDSNITLFCDQPKNITCCVKSTNFIFNWTLNPITGVNGTQQYYNESCSIFTLQSNTSCTSNNGFVNCTAYNSPLQLSINQIVTVRTILLGSVTVQFTPPTSTVGDSTTAACTTTTVGAYDNISWVIVQNGINVPLSNSSSITINGKKITFFYMTQNMSGTYYCIYTYIGRKINGSASTTVYSLPVVTVNPVMANVKCNKTTSLACCVASDITNVVVTTETQTLPSPTKVSIGSLTCYNYTTNIICMSHQEFNFQCTATNPAGRQGSPGIMMISSFNDNSACNDTNFGLGAEDAISISNNCPPGQTGTITAMCINKSWQPTLTNCTLSVIQDILITSQNDIQNTAQLQAKLPALIELLNVSIANNSQEVTASFGTISSVVQTLEIFSQAVKSITVSSAEMSGFIHTVSVLISPNSTTTWQTMNNNNATQNFSSNLLKSVEAFSSSFSITNGTDFSVQTSELDLRATKVNNSNYNETFTNFNTSGSVSILKTALGTHTETVIVSIVYATLSEILPKNINSNFSVNSIVLTTTVVNTSVNNVALGFGTNNKSLGNPQCVFWNFNLSGLGAGGWDTYGCSLNSNTSDLVTCSCNHTTSFSILMSPEYNFSKAQDQILTYISAIGLGISMGSLVLCLIIEILVWQRVTKNKTSYIRHVCIVNIAISLLIADIWFIIGFVIKAGLPSCSAAVFFTHFFYLAMFFWMLSLALLLFFRTVMVFKDLAKSHLMAIAFCLGYGCPVIIAVVTVATTASAKVYTRDNVCWLNWNDSKAMLAFIIPALVIIAINMVILLVVIVKLLRPSLGVRPRDEERSNLKIVGRSIAILTPFFGLTWGFGIGVAVAPGNFGINVVFVILNAFQGFFILVFGTLLDSKIREALFRTLSLSRLSTFQTKSTSLDKPSNRVNESFTPSFNIFGKKGNYNISDASRQFSSTTSDSNSYSVLN